MFGDHGSENCSINDSLMGEDESSITISSQVPSQNNRSLEDKLDRFFTEFESLSQRLQNLEQKESETAGSRINSGRDSFHVARQPVEKGKSQPACSVANAVMPGHLDRRLATITRREFGQQSSAAQISDESGGFGSSSRK